MTTLAAVHTLWVMPVHVGTPAYERVYPAIHAWLARHGIDADAQPARSQIEIITADDGEVYVRAWLATDIPCPSCPSCTGAVQVTARLVELPPGDALLVATVFEPGS